MAPGQAAGMLTAERVLQVALAMMQAAGYCFLITLDATGQPQARLVFGYGVGHDPDLTLRIATNPSTRKVGELRRDTRATVAYWDAKGEGYVTLIGEARLVSDLEQRRRWWDEDLRPFFRAGPAGEDFLLVEFHPRRVEVMSFADKIAIEPDSWHPAVLEWKDGRWVLQERGPHA